MVAALNAGVLLRFAGLDMLDPGAAHLILGQQFAADVFGTIVAAAHQWLDVPFHDLFQRTDHSRRWQRQVGFDDQTLSVVVVRQVEQTETAPAAQLIVHEVHRPDLVGRVRYCQRL
jgi:hypothetical protein